MRGDDGAEWHITELCSDLELQREGSWMHNCVATYSSWCQRGVCSIWTVTDNSGKQATIRLYPETSSNSTRRARRSTTNRTERSSAPSAPGRAATTSTTGGYTTTYQFDDRTQLELVG